MDCGVSILFEAGSTKGVVAVKNEGVDEGNVADGAHQVGVVVRYVVKSPKIDLGFIVVGRSSWEGMFHFHCLTPGSGVG